MAEIATGDAPASTAATNPTPDAPASTAAATEQATHETGAAKPEGSSDSAKSDVDFGGIEDMSTLESILEGAHDPELEKKKPAQQQEKGKEIKPTEEKPPVETKIDDPKPTEAEEVNLDQEKELAKNYRFRTEDPRMQKLLTLIRRNPDSNPVELAIQAGWEGPKATAAATEAQRQEQQQETKRETPPDSRVESAKQKVAELKTKLAEAEKNFESTAEIMDQLQDAKLDLRDAERQVQAEAQSEAHFTAQWQSAEAEAIKLAPETGKPNTPQYEEIQREVAFLESQNSEILNDPRGPLKVLQRVMARRPDLFPKDKTVAKTTETKPAPQGGARPTGQVESAATSAQPTALNSEQAARKIDDMSLEELQAIADMTGEKRR